MFNYELEKKNTVNDKIKVSSKLYWTVKYLMYLPCSKASCSTNWNVARSLIYRMQFPL